MADLYAIKGGVNILYEAKEGEDLEAVKAYAATMVDRERFFIHDILSVEKSSAASFDVVAVSQADYDRLVDDAGRYNAMRNHGVDNWCGYDDAMQEYREWKEGDE